MDEGEMRQVEQILDQQHVIGLELEPVAGEAPGGIVHPVEILDRRRIGQGRIAHPDPEPVIALDHGIAAHARARRDGALARHQDAGAARIVGESVIGTFERVAAQAPARQRRMAVAAAVGQGDGPPVLGAVEHHRLVEQDAAQEVHARDLVVPRRDIPAIAQEHEGLRDVMA